MSTPTPVKGQSKRQSVDPDLAEALEAAPLPAKRQALAKSVKEAKMVGVKNMETKPAAAKIQKNPEQVVGKPAATNGMPPIDAWVAHARPGLLAAVAADEQVCVVFPENKCD